MPQPAPILVWLLGKLAPREAASAAIGDVLDDLAARTAAARAPRRPRLWLNLQAIGLLAAFAVAGLPRGLRAAAWLLRDAARSLRRAPKYSALVVGLLSVGIAAATITYSVVDAVVLKPLALEGGDRLVMISTRDRTGLHIEAAAVRRIRDEVAALDGAAAVEIETRALVTIGGDADEVSVLSTNADLFRLLRFGPAIGRLWTTADEARGDTDVAVISYRYWIEKFRGDHGILGKVVVSHARSYRIVGVLGADTDVPGLDYSACAVWVPGRAPEYFGIAARMRPGVTTAHVADEVQRVANTGSWRPDVAPVTEYRVRPLRGWMLLALGAAMVIVLIACANAVNVMLTRSLRRGQELAIRSSLGASRRQIALSMVVEGVLLSLTAAAGALLFATWGIAAARVAVISHLGPIFRASTISLNGRVFLAAIATAVVTGVVASLAPAWHASRGSVTDVLKDAGPSVTGGARRWRGVLLVTEVACVSALLVVSWLFVSSLIRVAGVDLGVDRSHLIGISPRFAFAGTVAEVRRRLESMPGVAGVAVVGTTSLPLIGRAYGGAWIDTSIERADGDGAPLKVIHYRVSDNYFEVAGMPFRRGRSWRDDAASGASAVVIDEWAAARLFGDVDPLGRQILATEPAGIYTVVGVVPHAYSRGPEFADDPGVYFAMKPNPSRSFANLFVRTVEPAERMVPLLSEVLAPLAPPGKSEYIHPADRAVRTITATRRFSGTLMSIFGGIAIALGAAGIYGVVAAIVAQQSREIGVRMALGATPHRIYRGVLSLAGRHIFIGLAIGLPVAGWLSRGLSAYLFGVSPTDPSVYLTVTAVVAVVALAAVIAPARRASRTNPIIVMRG